MNATELPIGSIVASAENVWIKAGMARSGERSMPWITTAGSDVYLNITGDEEISDMIQQGAVRVLRVGAGE